MKFDYCMPSVAPYYTPPPYEYQDNQEISIVFRTAPGALQALLPPRLTPNPDALAFVYVSEFHVVSPDPGMYMEAGLGIPTFFEQTAGNYFVYLYLDSTIGVVAGREIWGFPKKDADISISMENGIYHARVMRLGVELIHASVNATNQVKPISAQPDLPGFNLKIIPSVRKSHPPDVLQLTSTTLSSTTKELYTGEATLSFSSVANDKLADIPILEIISGQRAITDMVLDCGDVLVDYLFDEQ
jgi:acetoacetate decarboxylase